MNILSINKYYWRKGGSESVFFNEMELLEEAGHTVVPFSMASDKNEETPHSRFFVDEVDYDKGGVANKLSSAAKIIYSFDAKSKMKTLLKEKAFDLAHFHIFQHQISTSVFGPLRDKKIPIILTLHDLKPICPSYKYYVNGSVCEMCVGGKFYNCFKNRCTKGSALGSLVNTVEMYFHSAMGYYKNVDRYIAVSHFYKKKMVEAGFPESQVSYLPNYIDASMYDPEAEDKGYMLYFGRLSEEKGVSTFLDSALENSDIPYLIVGTGPLEEALKAKAAKDKISNVTFLGFKQGEELKKLISESTCVVVPSEWYENCPMTILEAFASGRPVIGARIGGIPELINDTVDGLVFEPGDAKSLSSKVKWIWERRGEAKEMGAAARSKVESNFNREIHYKGLQAIYDEVLGVSPVEKGR